MGCGAAAPLIIMAARIFYSMSANLIIYASIMKIDSLQVSSTGAHIALCACPAPEPSLVDDLEALREWGARGLVTLVEDDELAALGVKSLPDRLAALGMRWWHLPIRDMQIPDAEFEVRWEIAGAELKGLIAQGASFAVHCKGGLGRTGMIAARILVELGTDPTPAIAQVRQVRPGAIETYAQEAFIYACRPRC